MSRKDRLKQLIGRIKQLSLAPFVYCSLQCLIFGSLVWKVDKIHDSEDILNDVIGAFSILTLLFYFLTHCSDPGFVTEDQDNIVEQISKVRLKQEISGMQSSKGKEMSQNSVPTPRLDDNQNPRIVSYSSRYGNRKSQAEDKYRKMQNNLDNGEKNQINGEYPDKNGGGNANELRTPEKVNNAGQQEDYVNSEERDYNNAQANENQMQDEQPSEVRCEATMVEEEEMKDQMVNFLFEDSLRSAEKQDFSLRESSSVQSPKGPSNMNSPKTHSHNSKNVLEFLQSGGKSDEVQSQDSPVDDGHHKKFYQNQTRDGNISLRKDQARISEFTQQKTVTGDSEQIYETTQISGHQRSPKPEDLQQKGKQITIEINNYQDPDQDNNPGQSGNILHENKKKDLALNLDLADLEQQRRFNTITTEPSGINSPQNKDLISNINKNYDRSVRSDDELFYEKRHCITCNVAQNLRTKHCKDCKRCVATYDHHCPWVGNCVGEKNKCPFFWFMIFQLLQILSTLIQTVRYLLLYRGKDFLGDNLLILFMSFVAFMFFIMVGILTIYHLFLMFNNLTTWENVSWHKISYLKDLPEDKGSPFDEGIMNNLKMYCKLRVGDRKFINWKITQTKIQQMFGAPTNQK